MLMAGLDGIKRRIEPPDPVDVDLYELEDAGHIQSTPGSLGEVLQALEEDYRFLLEGGVFTEDVIATWIS